MDDCNELIQQIQRRCTKRWTLMEVCGGQTHSLLRHGIDRLLNESVNLIHGPGCPVCVTGQERIDQALIESQKRGVILCTYGDMLRVPGTDGRTLLDARTEGADIRVVYSPLDVLDIATQASDSKVVFLAVGFETTAPATALLAQQALRRRLKNLRLLVAHVRVSPVLDQLLSDPNCIVQGVLAAGHVCTVMGEAESVVLAARHERPFVITGFSPKELLHGIWSCIEQLETGQRHVVNTYHNAVSPSGNTAAQDVINSVFEPVDTIWRGLGLIPLGGYRLRSEFSMLDLRSNEFVSNYNSIAECPSGDVLKGLIRPSDCPSFGTNCTPDNPLGAPMVSNEGACAAYYRYRI